MLKMAETILLRTDKEPTPQQLAMKAKEYAAALHDEMLTGLSELDIAQELAGKPTGAPAPRARPAGDGVPTLGPANPPDQSVRCPECDAPMKKRRSVHGNFWGCSKYPECRGTRNPGFGF